MRVNNIKTALRRLIRVGKHLHVEKRGKFRSLRQPQRLGTTSLKARGRLRVARREQRDLMPAAHQLISDVGDHALGATIELGRYTFVKRCYLRDA